MVRIEDDHQHAQTHQGESRQVRACAFGRRAWRYLPLPYSVIAARNRRVMARDHADVSDGDDSGGTGGCLSGKRA